MISHFYIGDIHGHAELLKRLVCFINDECSRLGSRPVVTFLGDLVDRGPDSFGVLKEVLQVIRTWTGSRVLLGNHDDMFLYALRARRVDKHVLNWLEELGGSETIASFNREPNFSRACDLVLDVAEDEIRMLQSADLLLKHGPFFSCHAGINGLLPIVSQHKDDLLWIRDDFLDRVDRNMPPVIHGHSITSTFLPEITENRISIDTGAYMSGRLTAMHLDHENKSFRFFQTDTDKVVEVEPIVINRGKGTLYDRLQKLYADYPSRSNVR